MARIPQPAPLRAAFGGQVFRGHARDMTPIKDVPPDVVEGMQRIALSIFTDMSNAGYSFREALAAIYVSGLQHATEANKERNKCA